MQKHKYAQTTFGVGSNTCLLLTTFVFIWTCLSHDLFYKTELKQLEGGITAIARVPAQFLPQALTFMLL